MARSVTQPQKGVPGQKKQPETPPSLAEAPENIEVVVEQQLDSILSSMKNLNDVQRGQIVARVTQVVQSEAFSGPLPHPRHFAQYDAVLPGGADRILTMTEKVVDSNIAVTQKAQKNDQFYRMTGMFIGATILLLLIVLCFIAGIYEHTALAAILLGSTVVTAVGLFVQAHRPK